MRFAARAELPLVLLIAPALLFPTPARLLVLIPVALLYVALRRATGSWVPPTPFNVAIGVILAMTAASIAITPDLRFSLDKIAGVTLGVLMFFAIVRRIDTPRDLWTSVLLFALAGAGLAVAGLVGTNWIEKFPIAAAVTRNLPVVIRGVRGAESGFHPNAVAGALVLFVPLQAVLVLLLLRRRAPDWMGPQLAAALVPAAFGLSLVTLVLTQSRGAIGGLAAACTLGMVVAGRTPRRVAALVVVTAVIGFAITGPSTLIRALNEPINTRLGSLLGRVELWSRAIYAIEDAPLGVGMNTFRRMHPVRYPTFPADPGAEVPHAHNQFLQVALDLGVPGLVGYLALCLTAFAIVWRAPGAPERRLVLLALGVGLLAHLAFGLTDAIPIGAKVGITFWWALALLAAAWRVVASGEGAVPAGVAPPGAMRSVS